MASSASKRKPMTPAISLGVLRCPAVSATGRPSRTPSGTCARRSPSMSPPCWRRASRSRRTSGWSTWGNWPSAFHEPAVLNLAGFTDRFIALLLGMTRLRSSLTGEEIFLLRHAPNRRISGASFGVPLDGTIRQWPSSSGHNRMYEHLQRRERTPGLQATEAVKRRRPRG
jgi:hypothetical protein